MVGLGSALEAEREEAALKAKLETQERDATLNSAYRLGVVMKECEALKTRVAYLETHLREHNCDFMHTEPKSECWCQVKR